MINVPEMFGDLVFNDKVMKERLTPEVYKSLHRTIGRGKPLDLNVANSVANAMKEWAIEKGATHFTHWFQPMTGITAEKHDSFISPTGDDGVIMEFSGKELIKGESDASSFPSGGLRATFEARGYTAWDPTSYAFIKDNSLCIPTVFCSWGGEALDMKTPLLRSIEAVSRHAKRVLCALGNEEVKHVISTVGPEQEYFLIDKEIYSQRKDLVYCGRTLFGAQPPKGQEVEHHYYGAIKPRIGAFMKDLDVELWKLGILAKTEHNEAAPAQHELAPIYTTLNTAADHNQITMETMRRVAERHGLVCLLHEKPFAGVNGSGKHINWSLSTNKGQNLFEPGKSPKENAQFLLFLSAVIRAVDEYQDILRASVATAGNDHRLGASEAPPAIISMFLGDELTAILNAMESGEEYTENEKTEMEIGVDVLPHFPKDTTDRNRTSPFAFTGNKFEFRMPGSALSVAGPSTVINTIVADVLSDFADKLETSEDITKTLNKLIRRTIREHKRIIFNGDGYSDEWKEEAARRGLSNLATTVEALPAQVAQKAVDLYAKHAIFTEKELRSRYEIQLESYCSTLEIEAATMLDLAKKDIIPAVNRYVTELSESLVIQKKAGARICIATVTEQDQLSLLFDELYRSTIKLEEAVSCIPNYKGDIEAKAKYLCNTVLSRMSVLRDTCDKIEESTPADMWPMPDYGVLMFSI
ncbi:MAG: glutamine synthetase type III [Ruminococcaceae bacterium]|nr:glutamine synthetase type III [Oscillospiraceae bacterium]